MEKILKKYTTIPDHLYVVRNADKQLERIIRDMERPGYVLVARQMGKTNLLFRAKKQLESSNRLLAYVDLSNYFEQERECYRNIIDCITEPNYELFEPVENKIELIRNKSYPPHKEYSRSLREILSVLNGDLVIILDEIDALRTADYSDHIFAQIRSTYFARTNFPEFNRITYVLSGVIEPTDLIKDRNKSPFNIGDKIYLDDFNLVEHNEFVVKSKLNINIEISKHIFDWTNGNPRLTFDICSDIEDFLVENQSISKADIDNLINRKYLISFDIPPVDHIRELVSGNAKVRKAINQLRKENTQIEAGIKQKLYLYGIISSDLENPKIKNKIVDITLSENWLSSIDNEELSLMEIGFDTIRKGTDLEEGIRIIKEVLESNENTPFETQLCHYHIGYAYHQKRDYKKSNIYLTKSVVSIEVVEDLYYRQILFRGLNHLFLDQFSEGEELLLKVIEEYKDSFPYYNALLNLSNALINLDFEKYIDRTESLLLKIVKSSAKVKPEENEQLTVNEYKTIAYYYLFLLKDFQSNNEQAKENIDNALRISSISYKPELLFHRYKTYKDSQNLDSIVELIIENNLKQQENGNFGLVLTQKNLFSYLVELEIINKKVNFDKLFSYTCNSFYQIPKKDWEVYFDIATVSSNSKVSLSFYKKIVEKENEIDDSKILFETFRFLAIGSIDEKISFKKYFEKYLKLFLETEFPISVYDISVFAKAIKFESDKKEIDAGLQLGNIIVSRFNNLKSDMEFESLIIYYWIANLYYSKKDRINTLSYVEKTLDLIDKFKNKKSKGSIIDEKGIDLISEHMRQLRMAFTMNRPVIVGKKYGRNEMVKAKYKDGKMIRTKYKKIEADVIAERCKIIAE